MGMRDVERRSCNFSYHVMPVVVEDKDIRPALSLWQWPTIIEHSPVVTSVTTSRESPEAVLLNEGLTVVTVCGVNLDNINPVFNDGIDTD